MLPKYQNIRPEVQEIEGWNNLYVQRMAMKSFWCETVSSVSQIPCSYLTKLATPKKTSMSARVCPQNCLGNTFPRLEITLKDQSWMFKSKYYSYQVSQTQIPGEYQKPVVPHFGCLETPSGKLGLGGLQDSYRSSCCFPFFSLSPEESYQLFPQQLQCPR